MAQANPTDVEASIYSANYIIHENQSRAFKVVFPDTKGTPKSITERASKFHNTVKVLSMIEAMRDSISNSANEAALFTIEQAFTEFEEARQVAKEEGQAAAMNGSTTGKAKLAGLWIDKISADVKADVKVRKLDDFYADNE